MADGISISVDGVEEIRKSYERLSKKVRGPIVKRALTQGTQVIAAQAKRNAPRKTGRLRKAIRHRQSHINTQAKKSLFGRYVTVHAGKNRDDTRGAYYRWAVVSGHGGYTGVPFINRAYKTKGRESHLLAIRLMERGFIVVRNRERLR